MAKFLNKSNSNYRYEPVPKEERVELSSLVPQYYEIVERRVRQGETLRSISLNYRIPVSELKRINRLEKDSEFFALSNVKIPVKANSLLSEILKQEEEHCDLITLENGAQNNFRTRILSSCTDVSDSDADMCIGYVSIHQILREKSTRREARKFLENMKADLERIKQNVVSQKSSLVEAAAALNDPRFVPLPQAHTSEPDELPWWRILLLTLALLLLLPLAYLLYVLHGEH